MINYLKDPLWIIIFFLYSPIKIKKNRWIDEKINEKTNKKINEKIKKILNPQ